MAEKGDGLCGHPTVCEVCQERVRISKGEGWYETIAGVKRTWHTWCRWLPRP